MIFAPLSKDAALKVFLAAAILLIIASSVICRYQWLPAYPYHEDGVATITYIESIAAGHVSFEELFQQRSPLGHALLAAPLLFTDGTIYSYRLANLFFFSGVLLLLFLIGRQTGQLWAGLLAMSFVGFSSLEGLFVGFVRFYLVFQFFFLLVWYLLNQYVFWRKKGTGACLFLAFLAAIFVHKLSLQLFPLAALTFLLSGRRPLRNPWFWLGAVLLAVCAGLAHFGSSLTLAPSDFNELVIGDVGAMFDAGESTIFYHYIKDSFPFGWSFIFLGAALTVNRRDGLLGQYYGGFLLTFLLTALLAPGDSPHYISHLFPAAVFCGMTGAALWLKYLVGQLSDGRRLRLVAALCAPLLLVSSLAWFGLENYRSLNVFGKGLTFMDEGKPHQVLKPNLKTSDVILSTEPGLSKFYLQDFEVLFLRQKADGGGLFSSFPSRSESAHLIDSVAKLDDLMNHAQGWVWLYGNEKYQLTVGPQMRAAIDRYVRRVIYYDEKNNIFVIGLNKSP